MFFGRDRFVYGLLIAALFSSVGLYCSQEDDGKSSDSQHGRDLIYTEDSDCEVKVDADGVPVVSALSGDGGESEVVSMRKEQVVEKIFEGGDEKSDSDSDEAPKLVPVESGKEDIAESPAEKTDENAEIEGPENKYCCFVGIQWLRKVFSGGKWRRRGSCCSCCYGHCHFGDVGKPLDAEEQQPVENRA